MFFTLSIRLLFLVVFFHLSTSRSSRAAAPTGLFLSVDDAEKYALTHNPDLAAATLRIGEARGRLQQSGRLTNPELEWGWSRTTTGGEGSQAVALLQRFPITSRLLHEKTASRHELAAAEAEVRDASRKLAVETRSACVKLLALDLLHALRVKQRDTNRELASFLHKRLATGETSALEVAQADLDTRQSEVELLQLATEKTLLVGQLRGLLGVGADTPLSVTGGLPGPKKLSTTVPTEPRPDVQAARERAGAAFAQLQQNRANRWEDPSFGVSYARERRSDEPFPLKTDHVLGLRFSLPLPFWNLHAGRIQEAEALAAKALKESQATQLAAANETSTATEEIRSLTKLLLELDEKVLPAALQIESRLRENFASGQAPLHEVLRARARALDLQRLRVDTLRNYHLALARIHRPEGSIPNPNTPSKKGARK